MMRDALADFYHHVCQSVSATIQHTNLQVLSWKHCSLKVDLHVRSNALSYASHF